MKNMNHVIATKTRWVLALIVFALFANGAFAQKVYRQYSDSWGKQGFNLTASENNKVEIVYSISEFAISDVELNKEILQNIHLKDFVLPNDAGYPDLPGFSKFIAIPMGAKANVKVIASRIEKFENIDMAPAPEILKEDDPRPIPYVKNQKVYSTNAFYPSEPVKVSETVHMRGVDAVVLGITPFQYNPVTKELIVYRDFKVEVSFEGGNGQFCDNRLRSRWFDPILEDALLNFGQLPKVNYNSRYQNTKDVDTAGCEYLIVVPNDPTFLAWADSIKVWRTMQGIRTAVITTTDMGGNTNPAIEAYINNAYNNWTIPPAAVLLIGDYGTSGNTINSPTYDSYCISDNLFADVTGDHLPDIAFARLTAQNATHLQTMITRFLRYEANPPSDSAFYKYPISALGWQDDRWFQICSEVVGGFWKTQGRVPVRINALGSPANNTGNNVPGAGTWSTGTNTSTVLNYFGPSGLNYIPAAPGTLGGFSGGTPTMVNNAINAGAFMLQHRDHGMETGWGEPAYTNTNISGLTNVGTRFPYIFSINCLTGKFNHSSECFAEKFHRYTYNSQPSGCLGIMAATEVSYSFVNDAYVWGMYDNMWPNFMPAQGTNPPSRDVLPAFGNVAGKNFLYQSSWPYNTSNKEVTYYLFHHHGDAFSTVYTNVPNNLTVVHDAALLSGMSTFTVTANAGALIGLTVNGEIIGVGTGTGAPVDIAIEPQLPGQTMVVTITLQDYYRYSSNVSIIPPTGPYVIKDSVAINDAAANNNGQLDYGESVLLSLRVKNVGSANAENVNVTISTTNPYVTITDSVENYGTVNANGNAIVNDGFAITVDENVPNNQMILLNVKCVSDTNMWNSTIGVTAYAPVLQIGSMTITNDPNTNNRLDPGETLDLVFTLNNVGGADCQNPYAYLTGNSPYFNINTELVDINPIAAAGSADVTFSVTAHDSTAQGTLVNLIMYAYEIDTISKAEEITIGVPPEKPLGTGTAEATYYPFYTYYENNKTQMLYLGSEIGSGPQTIKEIAFDFSVIGATINTLTNLTIKFKKTTLSQFGTAYADMTGSTTVLNVASYSMPSATGWCVFDINDYVFNGPDTNLIIELVWGDNGAYAQPAFKVHCTDVGATRVTYGYADSETPPNYDGNSTVRPNIMMYFIANGGGTAHDVPFKVIDGSTLAVIPTASVKVGSLVQNVNSNGVTVFNLIEGAYAYTANAPIYNPINNQAFTVANADTVIIQMSSAPLRTITFTVTDSATSSPIVGANITINSNVQTTNASGNATFGLYDGTYTYTATATNYAPKTAQLIVNGNATPTIIMRSNVGISEATNVAVSVYPNPAKDKIVVNTDRGIKQIKIVSLDGRTVLETNANNNNTEINVSNIDNGSYLLYIITNQGTAMKKITIMK